MKLFSNLIFFVLIFGLSVLRGRVFVAGFAAQNFPMAIPELPNRFEDVLRFFELQFFSIFSQKRPYGLYQFFRYLFWLKILPGDFW